MQTRRERYQQGSIRKVKRAKGYAWEFRYYVEEGGKRTPKSQYFDGEIYKTATAVRQKVEGQLLKLNDGTESARGKDVTFNALLGRYIEEEMPERHATKDGYTSIINVHLRPRWGDEYLTAIRPADMHAWFKTLPLAPITKGHIRSLMHKLFDLATLWEYLPLERRNPVEIVKIKDVTKVQKEAIVLTPELFREVVLRLPEHVNMIAMTAACLGLRVSEALGLKWEDIDWKAGIVTIKRSAYRGSIDDTKNTPSKARLPLHPTLAELLLAWKFKCENVKPKKSKKRKRLADNGMDDDMVFEWLFANPYTGMPYMSPSLQQRWVRPAGEAIGIKGLGFHSLRHSYRSWLDSAGVAPGVTKDLMRHSAISTTFNVYGRALAPEKREGNRKVVEMLLPPPPALAAPEAAAS
ncbi:MAG: site-specific integrase [Edaphobacter sp.]